MHLYPNWIFHLHSEIRKETKNSKMFKLKLQSRNNTKYVQGQSANDEVECLEECNCYFNEISLSIKLNKSKYLRFIWIAILKTLEVLSDMYP